MRQAKRVTITFRPLVLLAVIINFYFHLNRKPDAVALYYIILTHYNIINSRHFLRAFLSVLIFFHYVGFFTIALEEGLSVYDSDRKDLTIILHDHLNNMLLISLSL